jgi:hypothetical protein
MFDRCPFSKEAITRAVIERSEEVGDLAGSFHITRPVIIQSDSDFVDGKVCVEKKSKGKVVPSSTGSHFHLILMLLLCSMYITGC